MVGHGLEVLLEEAVGKERTAEGVRLFRERYAEVAVAKTRLMPDVPEVLETLAARGHPMAVRLEQAGAFLAADPRGVRFARHFWRSPVPTPGPRPSPTRPCCGS
jgi:hypothetical protein